MKHKAKRNYIGVPFGRAIRFNLFCDDFDFAQSTEKDFHCYPYNAGFKL